MILDAGNGDCIWITIDEEINILIDGGFISTYNNEIRPRVQEIRRKNQKLDLVVLTHYDVDHIGGISKLIEEESKYKSDTIIKEIWFNVFEDAKFPIEDNEEDNLSSEVDAYIEKFYYELSEDIDELPCSSEF